MDNAQKDLNSIIKFNTHLLNFINELNNLYPSLKTQTTIYDNLNFNSETYLVDFQKKISQHLPLLIQNDLQLIKTQLFQNIDLSNLELTPKTTQTILKYINVMFIQSFRYQKSKQEINDILRLKNQENISLEVKAFLTSIDNLKNKRQPEPEQKTQQPSQPQQIPDMKDNINLNQNLLNQLPLDNSIMNGSIGKLAMDIAKDIDMSQLDLSNPMEMLQGIMSGDVSKNSSLQNLFGNITTKITNKLNSGEVDTENILSEAQNIMSKTKDMPFNKNLFSNLQQNLPNEMKNMPNMEDMAKMMPNMEDMAKMMPDFNNLMGQLNTQQPQQSQQESQNTIVNDKDTALES